MIEIFKTCVDHCKDYMVSNKGNILSFKHDKVNGILMKPYMNNCGYLRIKFCNKNTFSRYFVHSLVIYYFYGPRPLGLQIDHINRIRQDNRISNLRYCTHSENQRNTKRFRDDILEQDSKKRTRILDTINKKINRNNTLCYCGIQRRFRFNHYTNTGRYKRFLIHLKSKRHKDFMYWFKFDIQNKLFDIKTQKVLSDFKDDYNLINKIIS